MRSGSRTASGFSQRTFERLESRCLLAATTYGNSGQPWNVPLDGVARIEGENYNQGGEGVGYHDTTSANLGGAYRTGERVDVESTAAASNGYNVGWIEPAEWLDYTLNVPQAGAYQINLRTARATAGNTSLVVSSNGVSAPTVIVPSTGDWFAFTTLSTTLTLSAGTPLAIAFAAPAIADPQPSPSLSEPHPSADEPAANDRHTAASASLEEATALIPHIRLAETARSETVLHALDPQLIDAALAEILSQIL